MISLENMARARRKLAGRLIDRAASDGAAALALAEAVAAGARADLAKAEVAAMVAAIEAALPAALSIAMGDRDELSLAEVAGVLRVSRQWLAAEPSMQPALDKLDEALAKLNPKTKESKS